MAHDHDHHNMATTMAATQSAGLAAADHSSHGSGSSSGHSIAFHFGTTETILFNFWSINSVGGLLVSWAIIFILCVAYEALKWYRMRLGCGKCAHSTAVHAKDVENKPAATPATPLKPARKRGVQKYLDWMRYVHTALNALQLLLGYLLMLIFMTFNGWLCSAVIIGDAVGYFIFFGGPAQTPQEEENHMTCN